MILYLSKDGTTFDKLDQSIKSLFKKFLVKTEPFIEPTDANTSDK